MEELLRIDVPFYWSKEFQKYFEIIKRKLVEDPILKFPHWSKTFHVHTYSSALTVSVILTQPIEGGMDNPNPYASSKLNE